jgi:hypothetical protein
MAKKPNLTSEHYHEFIDRMHVITSNIDTHILQHPVCKLDKELCTKVEKAMELLYEAYQCGGKKIFDINARYTGVLGLLNYEGDVLKMRRVGYNKFLIEDQWKKSLGVYTSSFIADFIGGKVELIDSQNNSWNFATAHENAKPTIEKVLEFIK